MTADYEQTAWTPDDTAAIMRQQSTVHTYVEHYRPPPVYESARGRFGTTGQLIAEASPRIRVAVGNVVLTLAGITASVFLVALVILGVHLWTWLA